METDFGKLCWQLNRANSTAAGVPLYTNVKGNHITLSWLVFLFNGSEDDAGEFVGKLEAPSALGYELWKEYNEPFHRAAAKKIEAFAVMTGVSYLNHIKVFDGTYSRFGFGLTGLPEIDWQKYLKEENAT